MSTNYYAKIIPSKKRKKELFDAIEADDFSLINKLTSEMYGSLMKDWDSNELIGGVVHLGKASGGWKFLWNPNIYLVRNGHSVKTEIEPGHYSYKWIEEPNTAKYLYPLTKKGIKAFIDREDVVIYDEYGEKQDKEEFWDMAIHWTTWQGKEAWDADSYHKAHFTEREWSCKSEFTDLLEMEGFELSEYKSDFFSDGLRFATSTEFS